MFSAIPQGSLRIVARGAPTSENVAKFADGAKVAASFKDEPWGSRHPLRACSVPGLTGVCPEDVAREPHEALGRVQTGLWTGPQNQEDETSDQLTGVDALLNSDVPPCVALGI